MIKPKRNRGILLSVILLFILTGGGLIITSFRRQMSQREEAAGAGFNGGFEDVANQLPVNWTMYTPKTVPDADFEIALDTLEKHEGKQSLAFNVRRCKAVGGWRSPGFSNELEVEPGATYEVSLWIKSQQAKSQVKMAAVSAFGEAEVQKYDLLPEGGDWRLLRYRCNIPKNMHRLRIELNVLSPGLLSVDDVRLAKIARTQHL